MKNEEHIDVPVEVIEALKEARDIGTYNMFDSNGIVNIMYENQRFTAVMWLVNIPEDSDRIRVNNKRYMAALYELGEILGLADELSR